MSDENKSNKKKHVEKVYVEKVATISILAYFIFIFLWIWIIAGIIAFIASLICFGYYGSTTDKFLGLLLVLVIGPFYWLFFLFNSKYCTREPL
jgi:hypothetical protein